MKLRQGWGTRLLAQDFLVVFPVVFLWRVAKVAEEALRAIATPVVGVVPVAFEEVGKKQVVVIGAGFDGQVLFAANSAVGQLLVAFRACKARDRRVGTAVGTAHDELQVAVAYLCHGGFLLDSVYLDSLRAHQCKGDSIPVALYIDLDIMET